MPGARVECRPVSFLDVILRGVALSGQALALGGVAFVLVVLRRSRRDAIGPDEHPSTARRALRLTALGAVALALAQTLALAVELAVLGDGGRWPFREALATLYGRAHLARLAGCVMLAAAALREARAPRSRGWLLALAGAVIVLASAATSHGVAQLAARGPLVVLTAAHQVAAALWVGGLVHLTAAAFKGDRPRSLSLLQRFSALALASVATLATSGVVLAVVYIQSAAALVGTAYGLMVTTKVAILAGLVGLGAANYRAVRRLGAGRSSHEPALRHLLEVEVGLGLTVLFVAASLTSTPPARDVVADRATPREVATIFTPRWPSFTSPSHAALAASTTLGDPSIPRTPEDTAWSEYNHHVAGAVVLTIGLLALVARRRWGRWGRHWPLLLLVLAAFMLVRDDPEGWPLGPIGFWEGMTTADVVQHRLFVLVVAAFGVFEWMVRTQRLAGARAALVFPLLCAAGAAMLLTHSHAVSNVKSEYLMEITHTPLALLGLVAGWARWLELRLPDHGGGIPERVWSLALAAVGVLLLLYREG